MSRFGQGGFSYMRRLLDPGLFSFWMYPFKGNVSVSISPNYNGIWRNKGFSHVFKIHSRSFYAGVKVFVENTSTKASVYFCFDIYLTFVGALLSNRGNLEIA